MNDFFAAIEFMQRYPQATGKVGITGFCYGGGVSNAAAVAYPELDTRINEGWPAYEAALKANNKVYEAYIYPGVNHGFHNDSTPRYDKSAADLAWQRTLKWFDKYLS